MPYCSRHKQGSPGSSLYCGYFVLKYGMCHYSSITWLYAVFDHVAVQLRDDVLATFPTTLPRLRRLKLMYADRVTDVGLSALGGLSQLRDLSLGALPRSVAGLWHCLCGCGTECHPAGGGQQTWGCMYVCGWV